MSVFRAKSTHQEDDEANQRDQAHATAAYGGPSKIEAATTEQQKQNNHQEYQVHARA
jgi:hypothetical protein